MTVTFQSVQSDAGTGSRTVTKPTNTAENDLLIAHFAVAVDGGGGSLTPPSGWAVVGSESRTATTSPAHSYLYYKMAGSSEPANYTFSYSTNPNTICKIARITGHNLSSPFNTSTGQTNDTASTTGTAPAIANGANNLLMFFLTSGGAAATTSGYACVTSNPTWTEQYDSTQGSGGGTEINVALATATRPQVTSTGNFTATLSASVRSIGHIVSIAPGADVTGTQSAVLGMTTSLFQVAYAKILRLTVELLDAVVDRWANPNKSSSAWTNQDQS